MSKNVVDSELKNSAGAIQMGNNCLNAWNYLGLD